MTTEEEFQELLKRVEQLPPEKRIELGEKLLGQSGLTVVFGGNNVIANSSGVQFNTTSQDFSEMLTGLPPEALSQLLIAIGQRMAACHK